MFAGYEAACTGQGEELTMDWSDTNEQATFRTEVRSMIADRLPEWYRLAAQATHGG